MWFCIMIIPAWDISTGYFIWGSWVVFMSYIALSHIKEDIDTIFVVSLLNAIMFNFGGYLAIILVLRFKYGIPIPLGGI